MNQRKKEKMVLTVMQWQQAGNRILVYGLALIVVIWICMALFGHKQWALYSLWLLLLPIFGQLYCLAHAKKLAGEYSIALANQTQKKKKRRK
jgi:type II secretory pathway component PulF